MRCWTLFRAMCRTSGHGHAVAAPIRGWAGVSLRPAAGIQWPVLATCRCFMRGANQIYELSAWITPGALLPEALNQSGTLGGDGSMRLAGSGCSVSIPPLGHSHGRCGYGPFPYGYPEAIGPARPFRPQTLRADVRSFAIACGVSPDTVREILRRFREKQP